MLDHQQDLADRIGRDQQDRDRDKADIIAAHDQLRAELLRLHDSQARAKGDTNVRDHIQALHGY